MYDCILVGYDGSNAAKQAVVKAHSLSRLTGSKLVIATVVPPVQFLLGELMTPIPVDISSLAESAKKNLEKLVEELRAVNEEAVVEYVVLEGDPAETLVDYAKENGCGLIVVGRRGVRGVERLLLGSVSSRLVALASGVDVLVVEPGEGREGGT